MIAVQPDADSARAAARDRKSLAALIGNLEQRPQRFTVPGDKPSVVRGAKGLRVRVVPTDLEHTDGSAPRGAVAVEMIELHKKEDFIRAQMPTVSGGRLLESGGAYYINMTADGRQLRLKRGKTLAVMLPKLSDREMELFYAARTATGEVNWKPAGAPFHNFPQADYQVSSDTTTLEGDVVAREELDSILVREPIPKYKDSIIARMEPGRNGAQLAADRTKFADWDRIVLMEIDGQLCFVNRKLDTTNQLYRTVKKEGRALDLLAARFYYQMQLEQMGWINCDRFLQQETIAVDAEIKSNVPLSRVETFVVFRDINSVMRNAIVPNGDGVLPLGKLPTGEPVKVIALAWANGKPYASVQTTTIARGVPVRIELKPSTKEAVERMIRGV